MSTLIDSSTVTARKPHRCCDCNRSIEPGERYRRTKTVGDGGWDAWIVCEQCQACVSDLWDADYRDENEDGYDCYAYLPDVDWGDVRLWSPLWAQRADLYRTQWRTPDGKLAEYPETVGGAE